LLNAAFAIAILDLISQVHLPSFVNLIPKYLEDSTFSRAEIIKGKANWIGHILRINCLLQQVIEGKIKGGIEVIGRRGRIRRKLLDDLKEKTGYI
jgi:hypothetical protein